MYNQTSPPLHQAPPTTSSSIYLSPQQQQQLQHRANAYISDPHFDSTGAASQMTTSHESAEMRELKNKLDAVMKLLESAALSWQDHDAKIEGIRADLSKYAGSSTLQQTSSTTVSQLAQQPEEKNNFSYYIVTDEPTAEQGATEEEEEKGMQLYYAVPTQSDLDKDPHFGMLACHRIAPRSVIMINDSPFPDRTGHALWGQISLLAFEMDDSTNQMLHQHHDHDSSSHEHETKTKSAASLQFLEARYPAISEKCFPPSQAPSTVKSAYKRFYVKLEIPSQGRCFAKYISPVKYRTPPIGLPLISHYSSDTGNGKTVLRSYTYIGVSQVLHNGASGSTGGRDQIQHSFEVDGETTTAASKQKTTASEPSIRGSSSTTTTTSTPPTKNLEDRLPQTSSDHGAARKTRKSDISYSSSSDSDDGDDSYDDRHPPNKRKPSSSSSPASKSSIRKSKRPVPAASVAEPTVTAYCAIM